MPTYKRNSITLIKAHVNVDQDNRGGLWGALTNGLFGFFLQCATS